MAHIFGTHAVDNGGIDMAVRRSAAAGLRAVQIFTAIPKFYGDKSSISPKRVERFHAALGETGIDPAHVVVHAAYVLSVATAEPDKWARAAAGLAKEMERSTTLGVGAVCFHPGSASDGDTAKAAERVAKAITAALRGVEGKTRLLVENTAGAGKTLGRTAAEVADILSHVPDDLRERTGYGLDTCHLFASGYDICSPEGYADTFKQLFRRFYQSIEDPSAAPEYPQFTDGLRQLNILDAELASHQRRAWVNVE